jgi:hypothetical protein
MADYYVHCPSTYLASLETNTTNPGNAYEILFAVGLGNPMVANPTTCPGQVCHADELYYTFATAETDGVVSTADARVGGDDPRRRVAVDRVRVDG